MVTMNSFFTCIYNLLLYSCLKSQLRLISLFCTLKLIKVQLLKRRQLVATFLTCRTLPTQCRTVHWSLASRILGNLSGKLKSANEQHLTSRTSSSGSPALSNTVHYSPLYCTFLESPSLRTYSYPVPVPVPPQHP